MIRSPRQPAPGQSPETGGAARSHPLALSEPDAQPAPPRALALSALDAAALQVFAALIVTLAARLSRQPWSSSAGLTVVVAALVGYALADLMSGVIHWAGDTFFAEDTPVIGGAFIHPFREHHRDPLAITRHGFLEVNGNNCLGLLPLLVPTWLLGEPQSANGPVPWFGLQVGALIFSIATFGTNQFHKWAHQPGPEPRALFWLRRSHLILDPAHHDRHHRAPHRSSYCVTVGWLNPMLDATGAFERAERALRRLARGGRSDAGRSDGSSLVASPSEPGPR